jgi:hypothetical protein
MSERSRVSRYIIARGRAVSRFASADVLPDCDGQALLRDKGRLHFVPGEPHHRPTPCALQYVVKWMISLVVARPPAVVATIYLNAFPFEI